MRWESASRRNFAQSSDRRFVVVVNGKYQATDDRIKIITTRRIFDEEDEIDSIENRNDLPSWLYETMRSLIRACAFNATLKFDSKRTNGRSVNVLANVHVHIEYEHVLVPETSMHQLPCILIKDRSFPTYLCILTVLVVGVAVSTRVGFVVDTKVHARATSSMSMWTQSSCANTTATALLVISLAVSSVQIENTTSTFCLHVMCTLCHVYSSVVVVE